MCSYCGCRETPEIGVLMTQHEGLVNDAGELLRRLAAGNSSGNSSGNGAAAALEQLAASLAAHVQREEGGLFAELRADPEFAATVAGLCDEHDEIDELVSRVRDGESAAAAPLVDLLRRHIDEEDNGLFPAVAVAVDGERWAAVAARVAS